MSFYVGSLPRLDVTFKDLLGALADPSTITLTVIAPDGTSTTYPTGLITRVSTGVYYYDLAITQVGIWSYRWVGAGALDAVEAGTVNVLDFPPKSTWSYSGDPGVSAKDEVRFLISDTDQAKSWTLEDAEIKYAIALYSATPPVIGRNFLAAAVCAETILGKLKAVPQSKSVGDLSISYGNQFKFYESAARTLRMRANLQAVPVYAGGMSLAEKEALAEDTDRVQPAIRIDGMNRSSNNGDPGPWNQ